MALLREPKSGTFTEDLHAPGLLTFVETVFGCLPRTDQRRWAKTYVKALLQTPGKKTPRRLAESVSDSPTASQALHQFVHASPWDSLAARQRLLRWAARDDSAVTVWTLAPAFLPKRGDRSAGVHRRFDPLQGRLLNCQLGMVVLATTEHGPLPVDWELYIPREWTRDRRTRARVPEEIRGPLWSQALRLVGRAPLWHSARDVPVAADLSWLPNQEAFLGHLIRNEQPFVVEVPDVMRVVGATPLATTGGPLLTIRQILRAPAAAAAGEGDHIVSLPVILPGRSTERVPLRLLARYRPNGSTRTWLTNLIDRQLPEMLPLMHQPRLAAGVVSTLSREFGLQDFEGRSFTGWHHHTTLVSAAFTYSRVSERAAKTGPRG
ncbi:transposase (plasmid) [Streptomyces cyaneofuscatus]|uniref:IS701 family transposase n=1 Tax=Streptomyces cyaneofuscatus TaxID=66883 RepID=UPI002F910E00|nr:transposase [Streptomyces cyaneofuscatus]